MTGINLEKRERDTNKRRIGRKKGRKETRISVKKREE